MGMIDTLPRRAGLVAAVCSAVLALGAGLAPVPGHAEDAAMGTRTHSAPASADGTVVARATTSPAVSARSARRVVAYWTPQRMRGATPLDTPASVRALAVAQRGQVPGQLSSAPADTGVAEPGSVVTSPSPATAGPVAARPARSALSASPAAGKVFFTSAGRDYVCSGSAVNSASKRLVATAGHCVHSGAGGSFHTNWMFQAGYRSGPAQDGRWSFTAHAFRTFSDWVKYGPGLRGLASDVAFVTTEVNPETGLKVVDAVGGMGLKTGGPYALSATLLGYPANRKAGERQFSCKGRTGKLTGGRKGHRRSFVAIEGCKFGGGASGGPWLTAYKASTGLGTLRTVSSFGPSDSTAFIAGPYFRSAVGTLLEQADGDYEE